jgi:hypothetical protein
MDDGMPLRAVAERFLDSPEFAAALGDAPADGAFVDALYANVLGREPDAGGARHWEGVLRDGGSQADVLVGFAQSAENKAALAEETDNGVWFV